MIKQKEKTKKLDVFWLRLTYTCNNSCIFCLDYENQKDENEKFITLRQIKKNIERVRNKSNKKIVLSGGEPTLHPQVLDVIKYAKKQGFAKIQLISNGRMFYYKKFLNEIIKSGIDEITISFHSHIPSIYEELTDVKGSYLQALQGFKNLLKLNARLKNKIIINIDIVINKLNLSHIKETILFFAKHGIYEFDLLSVMPFGRAMINKDILFFEYPDKIKLIKSILNLNKDPKFHIWLNRFPPRFLEGYEYMIQNPEKLFDEIRGRQKIFKSAWRNKSTKLECYSESRCPRCYIKDFCDNYMNLICRRKEKKDDSIELSLNEFLNKFDYYLKKYKNKKIIIYLDKFSFAESNNLKKIKKFKFPIKWQFKNIPYCLLGANKNKVIFDDFSKLKNKRLNLEKLTKFYIDNMNFVKPFKCQKCQYNNNCKGINLNFIRNLSYKILKPITEDE